MSYSHATKTFFYFRDGRPVSVSPKDKNGAALKYNDAVTLPDGASARFEDVTPAGRLIVKDRDHETLEFSPAEIELA